MCGGGGGGMDRSDLRQPSSVAPVICKGQEL